jgi:hypothetical protein
MPLWDELSMLFLRTGLALPGPQREPRGLEGQSEGTVGGGQEEGTMVLISHHPKNALMSIFL